MGQQFNPFIRAHPARVVPACPQAVNHLERDVANWNDGVRSVFLHDKYTVQPGPNEDMVVSILCQSRNPHDRGNQREGRFRMISGEGQLVDSLFCPQPELVIAENGRDIDLKISRQFLCSNRNKAIRFRIESK